MMALKVKTDTIAVLNFDKDFISFDVIIQKTSMSFETKVKGSHKVVIDDDFSSILAQWKKGMLLAFGGVPGTFILSMSTTYVLIWEISGRGYGMILEHTIKITLLS